MYAVNMWDVDRQHMIKYQRNPTVTIELIV